MKLRIDDDTVIEAEAPEELVRQLHNRSNAPTVNDAEWMEQTAYRAWQQTGTPVRWGNATNFIEDMIVAGLLRDIDKGENDYAPAK
jgi:hypothetical protein